ncbi:hypothetical protein [Candidatus Epulonipiscium viviparus]|uniref:hypothetical protein n=1 Tax=Candidatus Epulonipiscium viviparus TaxID=420336 RepID=UPI0027381036|nr:hypothetical protein [Candidatus Epulopiscium viviparus]
MKLNRRFATVFLAGAMVSTGFTVLSISADENSKLESEKNVIETKNESNSAIPVMSEVVVESVSKSATESIAVDIPEPDIELPLIILEPAVVEEVEEIEVETIIALPPDIAIEDNQIKEVEKVIDPTNTNTKEIIEEVIEPMEEDLLKFNESTIDDSTNANDDSAVAADDDDSANAADDDDSAVAADDDDSADVADDDDSAVAADDDDSLADDDDDSADAADDDDSADAADDDSAVAADDDDSACG